MACVPFTVQPGLFLNAGQGVWNNFAEPGGAGRAVSYNNGTMTASGPNGNLPFTPAGNQVVRHRFFGNGMFLAVLVSDAVAGPITHFLHIVDFTAPAITSKMVLNVGSDSQHSLPFLQPSQGPGSACFVGAPTNFGLLGLQIVRSDNGATICPFMGGGYNPNGQVIGEGLAAAVQIKDGGNVIAGPCPFPAGKLDVTPASQTFTQVKLGGCPQPPSTKTFTLKNTGTDCLIISAIANSGPYSVTALSQPLPVDLHPNDTMTVTVTFAPAAVGTFNNVALAVTRQPANGDDKLVCSGQAVTAQPAFTATPGTIDFGHVPVGTTTPQQLIQITNSGDVPIAITAAGAPFGSPYAWSGLNATLGCGQSATIGVTYTPAADNVTDNQDVTVIATPGGTKVVHLTGTGCIPNAVIAVPPSPFPDFQDVRQSYRMVRFITVGNTGDGPLSFNASLSGPDAALFGILQSSNSITDVVTTRAFPNVLPVHPCGGAAGPGKTIVAVAFFADPAHPLGAATATLTIDGHNDPTAQAAFTLTLTANIIAGNVVDVVGVFDRSGSMADPIPGGGTKTDAAVQAGQLLVQLLPPDLGNRIGVTRFSTTADTVVGMTEVTAGGQAGIAGQINAGTLAPAGNTAIAAGAMEGLKQFAVPRAGPVPANLAKSLVVLTDGMDNTAFLNPDDNTFYTVTGITALNPNPPPHTVNTSSFAPPPDVKVFAVGLGTGQDIDMAQLAALSSGAGGNFLVADPTQPEVGFQLMKYYTQIYMDTIDFQSILDPIYTIQPGQKHVIEFDLLPGDVGAMVVLYDLHGVRAPFVLESPAGETIDAAFVPPGFQLRSGFTHTSRFLDFRLPQGEPARYVGRWKVIIWNDGRVCKGDPAGAKGRELGFRGRDCRPSKKPITYGIAIGAGSNFRLQAYVSPGPISVGDPILLTGVVSEAGLPVTGCTVTVQAVSPAGQSWNLTLADDGAHQDGEANDGEYARLFTQTAVAGSYTFTFRATGYNHDNKPVTRETTRSKYVQGWLRPPPPGGGKPGAVDDPCCREIIRLLERELRVLSELVRTDPPRRAD